MMARPPGLLRTGAAGEEHRWRHARRLIDPFRELAIVEYPTAVEGACLPPPRQAATSISWQVVPAEHWPGVRVALEAKVRSDSGQVNWPITGSLNPDRHGMAEQRGDTIWTPPSLASKIPMRRQPVVPSASAWVVQRRQAFHARGRRRSATLAKRFEAPCDCEPSDRRHAHTCSPLHKCQGGAPCGIVEGKCAGAMRDEAHCLDGIVVRDAR